MKFGWGTETTRKVRLKFALNIRQERQENIADVGRHFHKIKHKNFSAEMQSKNELIEGERSKCMKVTEN